MTKKLYMGQVIEIDNVEEGKLKTLTEKEIETLAEKDIEIKKHSISPKELKVHTFITGQSGCGKSTLVTRLIEEIILRDAGNVLFFDYNYEFSKFTEIDQKPFADQKWNKNNCDEDKEKVFEQKWNTLKQSFKYKNSSDLRIRYKNISSDQKAHLYGIDKDKDAGIYWLIQLIDQTSWLNSKLESKEKLEELAATINRWFELRIKRDEENLCDVVHQIKQHLTMLDLTKFDNGNKILLKQPYISFDNEIDDYFLNEEFFEKLFNSTKFCAFDFLNFDYDYYTIRNFIALHTLRSIWQIAKEKFSLSKKEETKAKQKAIFIVIDEAHNIIPNDSEVDTSLSKEIIKLLKTIAAEGRKFGLFLILISQRPDKINKNVLSECDNFIMMKSTPPTIELLKKQIPIHKLLKDKLDMLFELETGAALYSGKFTNYEIKKVEGNISRTKT